MREIKDHIVNERSQGGPLSMGGLPLSAIFNAPVTEPVGLLNHTPDTNGCVAGKQSGFRSGTWSIDYERALDLTDLGRAANRVPPR